MLPLKDRKILENRFKEEVDLGTGYTILFKEGYPVLCGLFPEEKNELSEEDWLEYYKEWPLEPEEGWQVVFFIEEDEQNVTFMKKSKETFSVPRKNIIIYKY